VGVRGAQALEDLLALFPVHVGARSCNAVLGSAGSPLPSWGSFLTPTYELSGAAAHRRLG
jgi:hypothetical protein